MFAIDNTGLGLDTIAHIVQVALTDPSISSDRDRDVAQRVLDPARAGFRSSPQG